MMVRVVDYNPDWIMDFSKESKKLKNVLGELAVAIHHIGSTAVPGLRAKPIIDIMPEVTDLQQLSALSAEFEKLGYEVKGEYGIPGRRYFQKGGDHRTHQVHAFESGDPGLTRHLAFRDYLIAHDDVAAEYAALKTEIAEACNNDIGKYCELKDPFIKHHEMLALEWYNSQ